MTRNTITKRHAVKRLAIWVGVGAALCVIISAQAEEIATTLARVDYEVRVLLGVVNVVLAVCLGAALYRRKRLMTLPQSPRDQTDPKEYVYRRPVDEPEEDLNVGDRRSARRDQTVRVTQPSRLKPTTNSGKDSKEDVEAAFREIFGDSSKSGW
jgi:hypothetical protein